MQAYKITNFGNILRNTMLGIGAVALMGAAACGPQASQDTAQAAGTKQPIEEYTVVGQPLSAASNCHGNVYEACSLAVVVRDEKGHDRAIPVYSGNMENITLLEAVIAAEIGDGDTETIKLTLDNNGNKNELGSINIDGVIYRVSQITVEGIDYQP
jgi:hypothetical protein